MPGTPPANPRPRSLVPTATSTTDSPSHGLTSDITGGSISDVSTIALTRTWKSQSWKHFLGGQLDHFECVVRRSGRNDEVPHAHVYILLEPAGHLFGRPRGAIRSSISRGRSP